jgi:hypothetical protein
VLIRDTHANLKAIKFYLLQHQAEIEAYNQILLTSTTSKLTSSQPPATSQQSDQPAVTPQPVIPQPPKPQGQNLQAKTTPAQPKDLTGSARHTKKQRPTKKRRPDKAKR